MARQPLDQFAERIVRNNEVQEFIDALIEKGASLESLVSAINGHRYVPVDTTDSQRDKTTHPTARRLQRAH